MLMLNTLAALLTTVGPSPFGQPAYPSAAPCEKLEQSATPTGADSSQWEWLVHPEPRTE